MHGAGNGYVFLYRKRESVKKPEELAKFVSSPQTGIGADGLIFIETSGSADARMIMYNADGSRGRMCGNGIRCLGKFLYDSGLAGKEQTIETDAGIRKLKILENSAEHADIRVGMERPREAKQVTLFSGKKCFEGYTVSMGNPHFVLESEDPDREEVGRLGPLLEHHPFFPDQTNVEFVAPVDRKICRMRVWERGSGETASCGTGACAAVVALTLKGIFPKGRNVRVEMPGGVLFVTYDDDGSVWLTGPVSVVCKGSFFWEERP